MREAGKHSKYTSVFRTKASDLSAGGAPQYPPYFLVGCRLSNASGDADHDIDIGAGAYRDSDDANSYNITSMTKRMDAAWVSGSGQGGMATAESLTADKTYNVYGNGNDVFFSTTLPSAVSQSRVVTTEGARRLGSVLTYASQAAVLPFTQLDDMFILHQDKEHSVSKGGTTQLMVPNGIDKVALVQVVFKPSSDLGAGYPEQYVLLVPTDSPTNANGVLGVTAGWYRKTGHTFVAAGIGAYYDSDTLLCHLRMEGNTVGVLWPTDVIQHTQLNMLTHGWVDERTK